MSKHIFTGWILYEMNPMKGFCLLETYLARHRKASVDHCSRQMDLVHKIFLFQLVQAIRYMLIYLIPLSHEQHILCYDIFYLYGIDSFSNPLGVIILGMGCYLIYIFYISYQKVIYVLLMQIVINQKPAYFLHNKLLSGKPICKFIRAKAFESIWQNQFFTVALDLYFLYSHYLMLDYVVRMRSYFLNMTSIAHAVLSLFKLAIFEVNVLLFATGHYVMAHCYILIVVVFTTLTSIFFVKLDQVRSILLDKPGNKETPIRQVHRFINYHAQTMRHMLIVCKFFSKVFFAYLVCNFPLNLQLTISTFFRANDASSNKLLYFFCSLVILQQWIGFLVIHLVCSMYTEKLHQPSKLLLRWTYHHPRLPLATRLKVQHYYFKIQTQNRYGITYYRYGLMTVNTFFTFIFTYISYLLFTYNLLNYHRIY